MENETRVEGTNDAGRDRSIGHYVANIKETCTSIFEGMAVTFSYLFRPPITTQYPDRMPVSVQDTLPDRYRGHLYVHLDTCISCLLCEKACPIECIKIEDVRIEKIMITASDGKPTPKVKEPTRFDINLYKCMYCGLCVDPCPTGAIRMTKEFEGATENIQNLHIRFVSEERRVMAVRLGEEQERKAAEKKKAHAPEGGAAAAKPAAAASATAAAAPASSAAPAATATAPPPAQAAPEGGNGGGAPA
jgi:NADH-quinone oxidoreductase subunit I/NAD(P)H-quinone oxidoreductase subunit I